MNQINFLPDTFQKVRLRRQRRPIEFAFIGLAAIVLVGLWLYTSGPDRAMARQVEHLDNAIDRIEQQRAEQTRLQEQHDDLQRRLLIARETHQPIRVTQVLARLSELAPGPIRLVNIELVAVRPKPEPAPDPSAKTNTRVVASAGAKPQAAPREPNLMKIVLVGLAPSDEEIGAFTKRLEEDPVFTAVALRNNRMTQTKTHIAREFLLDLEIDLDRRFTPVAAQEGTPDAP